MPAAAVPSALIPRGGTGVNWQSSGAATTKTPPRHRSHTLRNRQPSAEPRHPDRTPCPVPGDARLVRQVICDSPKHADRRRRVRACCIIAPVRAELKHLHLEPDPATLPAEAESFSFIARMLIGPRGSSGEESFDVVVCSPEWLAARCREVGLYDARHHLVVNAEQFDKRQLRTWLESRVNSVHAQTWTQIGERIGRLGYWESEDYQLE